MTRRMTRRDYLKSTAAGAAALTILPAGLARRYAANEKVNVGIIGGGGRGSANTRGVADQGQNIAALCDFDRNRLAGASKGDPNPGRRLGDLPYQRNTPSAPQTEKRFR